MKLSVLVVSYNAKQELGRCLTLLGPDTEVVVVDNASTDGAADLVAREFPHVTLVRSPLNRGFGWGMNEAARRATGDAFLLLNPDAEVTPEHLQLMQARLHERPSVDVFGFKQREADGRLQLSFGPVPSLTLDFLRGVLQRRLDKGGALLPRALEAVLSRPVPMPWVSAAALLIRRSAFERIGGFDERFFLYFEDIDLCLRVRQSGGQVLYDPSVVIRHLRGASAKSNAGLAARAYRDSQLYFWQKHRGPWARRFVEGYLRLTGKLP